MGFRLEVTKKRNPEGAETEYVSSDEITLGQALQMVALMFSGRWRGDTVVTDWKPEELSIYFPFYIGFTGDKPIVLVGQISGYSGGYGFRFKPLSEDGDGQLMEMTEAYLRAFPELASAKVEDVMQKAGLRAA